MAQITFNIPNEQIGRVKNAYTKILESNGISNPTNEQLIDELKSQIGKMINRQTRKTEIQEAKEIASENYIDISIT
ncbi:MAG: hypothetical protein OMM_06932 [Candidatus Magnetoglobus multicellularis str. Araruama]|uniref:Uncharacterized protein n=1 Tax=Candidatus Magnetoglobus multicellularis str. Araruama TaxID=890399 RepID=A0A1V1PF56_9BACT|nr:MAG: hypothetical protein OMM_06932 [Candidatus Magnetoglobus multicellularis str. Araruama]